MNQLTMQKAYFRGIPCILVGVKAPPTMWTAKIHFGRGRLPQRTETSSGTNPTQKARSSISFARSLKVFLTVL